MWFRGFLISCFICFGTLSVAQSPNTQEIIHDSYGTHKRHENYKTKDILLKSSEVSLLNENSMKRKILFTNLGNPFLSNYITDPKQQKIFDRNLFKSLCENNLKIEDTIAYKKMVIIDNISLPSKKTSEKPLVSQIISKESLSKVSEKINVLMGMLLSNTKVNNCLGSLID